jgi:hypothetical protein
MSLSEDQLSFVIEQHFKKGECHEFKALLLTNAVFIET